MRLIIVMPLFLSLLLSVEAQSIPPRKFDGFVYGNPTNFNPNQILIEVFFDPVCPDSRDAWPPLKQLLQSYDSKLSLIVHLFPLPYHDNAFITSRALHIVNDFNSSATFSLWEGFFKHQAKFYNAPTSLLTKIQIKDQLIRFVSASAKIKASVVKSGFNDTKTDLKTRVSFKYGTTRGVFGTPAFFVNGFVLPGQGSPLDYQAWTKVIDPLVSAQRKGGALFMS